MYIQQGIQRDIIINVGKFIHHLPLNHCWHKIRLTASHWIKIPGKSLLLPATASETCDLIAISRIKMLSCDGIKKPLILLGLTSLGHVIHGKKLTPNYPQDNIFIVEINIVKTLK